MNMSSRMGTSPGRTARRSRGEAPEKSTEGDLHLHPGELLAQALVDPVPEGDVL